MKNYWFRICFEREFEDEEDAELYLEKVGDDIFEYPNVKNMSSEFEERAK
jgi:hypothetical protein